MVDAALEFSHCWYAGFFDIHLVVVSLCLKGRFWASWQLGISATSKAGNGESFFPLYEHFMSKVFVESLISFSGPHRYRHHPLYRSSRGKWLLPRVPLDVYGKFIAPTLCWAYFVDTVIQIARGITGLGVGGEYPSCSTSAAEAAKYAALLIQNFGS